MNWRLVCAGLAAVAFVSKAAAQDDRNSYYWSNGVRVAVTIAPNDVAVRFAVAPDAALIASAGSANGLRPNTNALYSPLRQNRVVVYSVTGATPITNRYLAELQDRLRASGVTDVTRVLTTATGRVASLAQQLSVGFIDGIGGLADLRGLDVERSISIARTLSERPLVVAYNVNADSELTSLEIANAIYEYTDASNRRLVTYAEASLRFPAELRAVPNQPRHPNDPLYPKQWHLNGAGADVDAPEAWDYTRGSPSAPLPGGCVTAQRIRIAVLDNGVETGHPDLVDNLSADGKDYTMFPEPGDDPNPSPTDTGRRHGTQAAGVIAACGHNSKGVSGICPLCEILPIKVDAFDPIATAAALRDSVNLLGADVVSNSWGTNLSGHLIAALDNITGANPPGPGVPVFFAMPNSTTANSCATDTSGSLVIIAVGASDPDDVAGAIAGSGPCIDLVAPTVGEFAEDGLIITTDLTQPPGDTYTVHDDGFGGTSAATALAAGVAGLVLSLNPTLTQQDVRAILQHTAQKITLSPIGEQYVNGFSTRAGYGKINAHRAVVPVVKIKASKHVVQVNEPFDITVSASAPHLLSEIGYSTSVGACPVGNPEWHTVDGKAFHEETWTGLTLASPGIYRFHPNAKDSLWPAADGYPHIASDAFPTLDDVVIEVQGTGAPTTGCTTPMPPSNLRIDH